MAPGQDQLRPRLGQATASVTPVAPPRAGGTSRRCSPLGEGVLRAGGSRQPRSWFYGLPERGNERKRAVSAAGLLHGRYSPETRGDAWGELGDAAAQAACTPREGGPTRCCTPIPALRERSVPGTPRSLLSPQTGGWLLGAGHWESFSQHPSYPPRLQNTFLLSSPGGSGLLLSLHSQMSPAQGERAAPQARIPLACAPAPQTPNAPAAYQSPPQPSVSTRGAGPTVSLPGSPPAPELHQPQLPGGNPAPRLPPL